jgi:uncharacterized membrane protein YdjX (TVP38/TMEM64 family)
MKRLRLVRLLLLVLVVLALVAAPLMPAVQEAIERFRLWVGSLGPWGPVLLAVAYTPACLLLIPGTLLSLGAGALFGVVPAVFAVSIGSTIGAVVAFLVARTLGRHRLEKRLRDRPWFAPLDRAVAENGFKIVLLTRLTPVLPYGPLSYGFGLTRVAFGSYFLATWLGMLPATVVYVYLGSTAKSIGTLIGDLVAGRAVEDLMQVVFLLIGLFAAVTVTVLLTRIARRALREAMNRGVDVSRETQAAGVDDVG